MKARHKRIRRIVAAATVLGTLGIGVGLAAPAGAAGRYRGNQSGNGCSSSFQQNNYHAESHSTTTGNSNQGFCF